MSESTASEEAKELRPLRDMGSRGFDAQLQDLAQLMRDLARTATPLRLLRSTSPSRLNVAVHTPQSTFCGSENVSQHRDPNQGDLSMLDSASGNAAYDRETLDVSNLSVSNQPGKHHLAPRALAFPSASSKPAASGAATPASASVATIARTATPLPLSTPLATPVLAAMHTPVKPIPIHEFPALPSTASTVQATAVSTSQSTATEAHRSPLDRSVLHVGVANTSFSDSFIADTIASVTNEAMSCTNSRAVAGAMRALQAKIAELRLETKGLRQELDTSREELKAANNTITRLRSELSSAREEANVHASEYASLLELVNEKERKLVSAKLDAKMQCEALEAKLLEAKFDQERAVHEAKLSVKREMEQYFTEKLEAEIASMKRERDEQTARQQQLARSLAAEAEALEQRHAAALEAERNKYTEERRLSQKLRHELEEALKARQQVESEFEEYRARSQIEIQQLQQRLLHAEQEIRTLEHRNTELHETLQEEIQRSVIQQEEMSRSYAELERRYHMTSQAVVQLPSVFSTEEAQPQPSSQPKHEENPFQTGEHSLPSRSEVEAKDPGKQSVATQTDDLQQELSHSNAVTNEHTGKPILNESSVQFPEPPVLLDLINQSGQAFDTSTAEGGALAQEPPPKPASREPILLLEMIDTANVDEPHSVSQPQDRRSSASDTTPSPKIEADHPERTEDQARVMSASPANFEDLVDAMVSRVEQLLISKLSGSLGQEPTAFAKEANRDGSSTRQDTNCGKVMTETVAANPDLAEAAGEPALKFTRYAKFNPTTAVRQAIKAWRQRRVRTKTAPGDGRETSARVASVKSKIHESRLNQHKPHESTTGIKEATHITPESGAAATEPIVKPVPTAESHPASQDNSNSHEVQAALAQILELRALQLDLERFIKDYVSIQKGINESAVARIATLAARQEREELKAQTVLAEITNRTEQAEELAYKATAIAFEAAAEIGDRICARFEQQDMTVSELKEKIESQLSLVSQSRSFAGSLDQNGESLNRSLHQRVQSMAPPEQPIASMPAPPQELNITSALSRTLDDFGENRDVMSPLNTPEPSPFKRLQDGEDREVQVGEVEDAHGHNLVKFEVFPASTSDTHSTALQQDAMYLDDNDNDPSEVHPSHASELPVVAVGTARDQGAYRRNLRETFEQEGDDDMQRTNTVPDGPAPTQQLRRPSILAPTAASASRAMAIDEENKQKMAQRMHKQQLEINLPFIVGTTAQSYSLSAAVQGVLSMKKQSAHPSVDHRPPLPPHSKRPAASAHSTSGSGSKTRSTHTNGNAIKRADSPEPVRECADLSMSEQGEVRPRSRTDIASDRSLLLGDESPLPHQRTVTTTTTHQSSQSDNEYSQAPLKAQRVLSGATQTSETIPNLVHESSRTYSVPVDVSNIAHVPEQNVIPGEVGRPSQGKAQIHVIAGLWGASDTTEDFNVDPSDGEGKDLSFALSFGGSNQQSERDHQNHSFSNDSTSRDIKSPKAAKYNAQSLVTPAPSEELVQRQQIIQQQHASPEGDEDYHQIRLAKASMVHRAHYSSRSQTPTDTEDENDAARVIDAALRPTRTFDPPLRRRMLPTGLKPPAAAGRPPAIRPDLPPRPQSTNSNSSSRSKSRVSMPKSGRKPFV